MEASASGSGEVTGDEDHRLIFCEQEYQPNRWSFLGEVVDVLFDSVHRSFPHVEELKWFESAKEKTVFYCLSVFTISSIIRNNNRLRFIDCNMYKVPQDIGWEIKTSLELSAGDMIQTASVQEFGIVALLVSRQYLAKSIHKMLKDGIDTWTPPLPMGRVVIDFSSLDDKILMGSFRQHAIANTLKHMLMYSKVDVQIMPRNHMSYAGELSWEDSQISIKQRGRDLVISVEEKPPFILAEEDFKKFYIDLESLRRGINVGHADWIVYVTPTRQQEYIDMCFTAAKLKGWIKADMDRWDPSFANEYPVLTCAGYRTYSTIQEEEELANLLNQLQAACDEVAQGTDARMFEYDAQAVLNCVLVYTCLKNHRLTDCKFKFDEMVNEEGNTFVYLLQRRAEVCRITYNFRKDIDELKKTSDLVLEEYEGLQELEERILEFHLLKFTSVLEESILFVSPHAMCNYLYDLSKKFKSYIDSVPMTGSVAETSRLLLCEATAVVMKRGFELLGFTPKISSTYLVELQSFANVPMDVEVGVEPAMKKQRYMAEREQMDETFGSASLLTGLRTESPQGGLGKGSEFVDYFLTPCFVSDARDPCRKSRFEVFSIRPLVRESTYIRGCLFGLISVSDNYGLQSDGGYPLYEPEFPYVTLFDREWYDPVDMTCPSEIYLDGYRSVPFSSSVSIRLELDASNEKKDACYQVCDKLIGIDLKDFWAKKINAECRSFEVKGEDGSVVLYYIPIKDAVDAALEISFKGEETYCDPKVFGHIFASYGGDFSYDSHPLAAAPYKAVLFSTSPTLRTHSKLRMPRGLLPLKRSSLAVPRNSSLVIHVSFVDGETSGLIFSDEKEFIPPTEENSERIHIANVEGTNCSLELKVVWK